MKIINVMGVSLDGKIATKPLEDDAARLAMGFGSPIDQEHVRQQILRSDAIITGANSMRASGGAWEQTGRNGKFPSWMVMTQSGLAPHLPFWKQNHIPRVIISPTAVEIAPGPNIEAVITGPRCPAEVAVEYLQNQGAETVLLFGGGHINRMFYDKHLVDELKITVSPFIVGCNQAPNFVLPPLVQPVQLALLSSHSTGNHVFLHYKVLKKACC